MSEEMKGMFGITSETKASNASPFMVATKLDKADPQFPNGWKFPTCRLVNVISEPEFEKKDGSKVSTLQFVFKDADNRQHIHFEWAQEVTDADFKKKHEGLNVRIKHIYTVVFGSFPNETGIGSDATSYGEFFTAVANAFNSQTAKEGDKVYKVYSRIPLYYKTIWYKNNFGFPLSPNFLERADKTKPCTLTIDLRYDSIEPAGKPKLNSPMGGGEMPDDIPQFDQGYS